MVKISSTIKFKTLECYNEQKPTSNAHLTALMELFFALYSNTCGRAVHVQLVSFSRVTECTLSNLL